MLRPFTKVLSVLIVGAVLTQGCSYSRGAGIPLRCPGDMEYEAGLCYPACQPGYAGVGAVCWESCLEGYADDGATCRQDVSIVAKESYSRGVGVPVHGCADGFEKDAGLCYPTCTDGFQGTGPVCWRSCPEGYGDDGTECRKDVDILAKESYGRGVGTPLPCSSDEERDAGLCYAKCQPGYQGVGPVCWGSCPEGYADDGATCRKGADIFDKESYARGEGLPLSCTSGEESDAGLCYPECNPGFQGAGPLCWGSCPEGYADDGATCRRDADIFGKDSYNRGEGTFVGDTCADGLEADAGLCYPECREGYQGVGPVCWQIVEDQPSQSTAPAGAKRTVTFAVYLVRQQVWEGPIPYQSVFGQGIDGQLNTITNPVQNGFAITLHGSSKRVNLAPGASTSTQEMTTLFGNPHPVLPVTLTATVDTGTTVWDRVRVDVNYTFRGP
jgi:hypothetical protein